MESRTQYRLQESTRSAGHIQAVIVRGTNRRQRSTLSVDLSSKKFNKERKENARERKICLILSIVVNGKDMSEMKVKWLGAQPLRAPGDHPQLLPPLLILAALPTIHFAC